MTPSKDPIDMQSDATNFSVLLRHNPTGEERLVRGYGEWDESTDFLWTEGNNGCDCNRALHFYDWGPEAENRTCGDTEFTAVKFVLDDGREIPVDD